MLSTDYFPYCSGLLPMTIHFPSSSPTLPESLQAFEKAAAQGEEIYLDGQTLVVRASGTSPQGRQVDWVASTGDAAVALMQALEEASGAGLGAAISRELGLSSAPGKPIQARTVERAIEMADVGSQVLEGVDFPTRLNLSAEHNGAGFIQACERAGVQPSSFDGQARARIDESMARHFDEALKTGQSPVSAQQAREWLDHILQS